MYLYVRLPYIGVPTNYNTYLLMYRYRLSIGRSFNFDFVIEYTTRTTVRNGKGFVPKYNDERIQNKYIIQVYILLECLKEFTRKNHNIIYTTTHITYHLL
jgi:hypothetical protein